MGLFDDPKPEEKHPEKIVPFYRVYTIADEENTWEHEQGSTIEAIAVGNVAHYVVKNPNGTIDAMYPFSSVESVQLIKELDEEEQE